MFDFETDAVGELSFRAGEEIILTEWVNEEWIEGKIGNTKGIFPLNFVEVIEPLPKPVTAGEGSVPSELIDILYLKCVCVRTHYSQGTPKKKTGGEDLSMLPRAVAKSNYQAKSDNECSLKASCVVELVTN